MAAISTDEVRRIARLARLTLDDAEVVRLAEDLGRILEYVSHIAELELPAGEVVPEGSTADLRDDSPRPGLAREQVEANAPAMERGHFIVPRVVGP